MSMAAHRTDIVIPIYKATLDEMEFFSIDYSLKQLAGRPVVFVHPEGLDVAWYRERFGGNYLALPKEFFASHRNYNQLCYEAGFYAQFSHCTHMLLLQPDAIVARDDLDRWCATRYDYIGAPECQVYTYDIRAIAPFDKLPFLEPFHVSGCNGGLSLRRIGPIMDVLQEYKELTTFFRSYGVGIGEDIYFSLMGKLSDAFQVANEFAASKFAITDKFREWMDFNGGVMPFGFHAWYREKADQDYILQLLANAMASSNRSSQQ
jgi:hypothetical protein